MGSFDWFPGDRSLKGLLKAGIPFHKDKRKLVKSVWDTGYTSQNRPESDEFYAAKSLENKRAFRLKRSGGI